MKKVALLVIVLVVVIGFFYYRNFLVPQDKDRIGSIGNNLETKEDNGKASEKKSQEPAILASEFLEAASSVLSGDVEIQRFWFPKDGIDSSPIFYVEYLNIDSKQRRALIKKNGEGEYEVVASFFPGRNEWELESGNDLLFGSELVMYEN